MFKWYGLLVCLITALLCWTLSVRMVSSDASNTTPTDTLDGPLQVTFYLEVARVDNKTHADKGLALVYWKQQRPSMNVPIDIQSIVDNVLKDGEPVWLSDCPDRCQGDTSLVVTRYFIKHDQVGHAVYRYDVESERKKLNRLL